MHVAYLCSRYPDVSHTFIQREVLAMRRLGLQVATISIRRARPEQVLSRADHDEFERTYAILPPSPGDHLAAHARTLLRHPLAWARTLARSLRLSPGGARAGLWRVFYFAEAVVVFDICRRRGIQHLHAHFANVGSDVAQLAAALGREAGAGPSWSFTMHGSTELYDVTAHRLPEKVRDALFVACISDFTRSQLMLWAPEEQWEKLRIARCGVDTASFSPAPRKMTPTSLRILCVSRLTRGKGLPLLLEAIASLVHEGVEATLTVVGDGPERAALERRARALGVAGQLELLGSVSQDEIRALYDQADAFCLPSFAEGVPVVLMEAMAAGLPVVATAIAGVPELVEHERSGLLVRPSRADELAAALERLARSPELRESLGAAGRERVVEEYDLELTARRLRELFAEMLEAPVSAHSRPRSRAPATSAAAPSG
jgi:colanic acid/amylovoran biosynthesis glycosyltransferase